jgi:hypothetical protein
MYNKLDENDVLYATMDPILNAPADYVEALANFKHSFLLHRRTKLPFSLYQHSSTYIANTPENNVLRAKLLKDFIEWTMAEFTDVWYVTNQQLIEWIQNPVPLNQMQDAIPCGNPLPVNPVDPNPQPVETLPVNPNPLPVATAEGRASFTVEGSTKDAGAVNPTTASSSVSPDDTSTGSKGAASATAASGGAILPSAFLITATLVVGALLAFL